MSLINSPVVDRNKFLLQKKKQIEKEQKRMDDALRDSENWGVHK